MAVTDATKLSDFSGYLRPDRAAAIFDEAAKSSVVQSLVQKVPIGINGSEIPIVTGRPEASWVNEGEQKPVTKTELGMKVIKPHKLACIAVVSAEVVRANPGNYMEVYKKQVAEAFAKKFDQTALYGNGPFDTHLAQTTKTVTLGTGDKGLYGDLVSGLDLLLKAKKKLNGFVFDTTTETLFLDQVDANKRPIFIPSAEVSDEVMPISRGQLLGRKARLADDIEDSSSKIVGFGGDWSKCAWGVTSGISYRISTEATVTINGELKSLFERNLVAILAEAEYGWLCADKDAFVSFKTQ